MTDELTKYIQVREDNTWTYSHRYVRQTSKSEWRLASGESCKLKEQLWFTYPIHTILLNMGIVIDKSRSQELENLFDGNLNGIYYLGNVYEIAGELTGEAIKWILGGIAAHLNEYKLKFSDINTVMPADYLAEFVVALADGRLDRGYSKELFAELLKNGIQYHPIEFADDMTMAEVDTVINYGGNRRHGNDIIKMLSNDSRFKAADGDEIDSIIESVISANQDQANKVAENPKLLGWFVGQVMKVAQGKAPAATVQNKLKQRFSI